jgi:hypothetical protein
MFATTSRNVPMDPTKLIVRSSHARTEQTCTRVSGAMGEMIAVTGGRSQLPYVHMQKRRGDLGGTSLRRPRRLRRRLGRNRLPNQVDVRPDLQIGVPGTEWIRGEDQFDQGGRACRSGGVTEPIGWRDRTDGAGALHVSVGMTEGARFSDRSDRSAEPKGSVSPSEPVGPSNRRDRSPRPEGSVSWTKADQGVDQLECLLLSQCGDLNEPPDLFVFWLS